MSSVNLTEKWEGVLDFDGLPEIKDAHKRATTAVLLENQSLANKEVIRREPTMSLTYLMEAAPTNSMGQSETGNGAIDFQDPVLISLVRRSMPNLMAFDVCGVQAMTGPTGLIFALRSRYGSQDGIEALFNEANTVFTSTAAGNNASVLLQGGTQTVDDPTRLMTGQTYNFGRGMSTAAAEGLGSDRGNDFQEMALSLEKMSVVAKSRAIKAEYSHELAQDLRNVHGLDAETELANILSREILSEINREVIRSIYATATIGAAEGTTSSTGFFDLDVDSNGRWMEEKFKGLLFQVEREANSIARTTRQGKGNFIITSSDVAAALNMVGVLKSTDAVDNLNTDVTGNTYAGMIMGRTKVYIDPYFTSTQGNEFIAVGYKGASPFDAGLFYCPYVPLQMYKTMGENSFQPKIGFKTRYGMVAHPFATSAADGTVSAANKNSYYRLFAVKNLV